MFSGSLTALVTPWQRGAFDEAAYARLIDRQIEAGTSALVAVGTTGESPTLGLEEHAHVIAAAVRAARGRVPVIAGCGSNDTSAAIGLVHAAALAGADGVMATTGYYNKPSQAGLYAHFEALAEASALPIILYNVPGRTACDIVVETIARLAKLPSIVAVKDATGDLARVARTRVLCGEGFTQLSGEDATAVGFNAMGGVGCISVLANVAPVQCAAMQRACAEGRWDEAVTMQDRLIGLADALFADTSPGPVKYALAKLGLCEESFRLPMVPASEAARRRVDDAMAGLDL